MKVLKFMSFLTLLAFAAFAVTSCTKEQETVAVPVPADDTPVAEAPVVPEADTDTEDEGAED